MRITWRRVFGEGATQAQSELTPPRTSHTRKITSDSAKGPHNFGGFKTINRDADYPALTRQQSVRNQDSGQHSRTMESAVTGGSASGWQEAVGRGFIKSRLGSSSHALNLVPKIQRRLPQTAADDNGAPSTPHVSRFYNDSNGQQTCDRLDAAVGFRVLLVLFRRDPIEHDTISTMSTTTALEILVHNSQIPRSRDAACYYGGFRI